MVRIIDTVDSLGTVVRNLSATSSAATTSTGTGEGVNVIRIVTDTDIHLRIGKTGVVATTNDSLLPAGVVERFKIPASSFVSVIKKTGAQDGIVTITEMTQ